MAKEKKHHTGLKIFLILLVVLIVLPVSLAYIFFFDTTTTSFVGSDSVSTETLANRKMVDAMTDSKTSAAIDFEFDQDDVNQLLYQAHKQLPAETTNYVKKFYCDIDGSSYTFSFDVTVPLFQSRLRLVTSLATYDNDTGRGIVFTINDLKIGRTGGLKDIAISIASNFINDKTLTDMFASAGLNMNVSLSNATISYPRENYVADLKTMLGKADPVLPPLLDEFFGNNLTSLKSEGAIGVGVDLTKLNTNASYCDPDHTLGIDVKGNSEKLQTLLNKGVIDDSQEKVTMVMNYLIRGYALSESDVQAYVSGKDFSSIGITDVTAYTGANLDSGTTLTETLKNRINAADVALGKIGYFDETDINNAFKATSAIGEGAALRYKGDDSYKVSCACVDDFYTNIFNEHIYMTMGLSVNGYKTSVIFDTASKGVSGYKMSLQVSNLYFGTLSASTTLKDYFYDMLAGALDGEDTVSFDKTTGTFAVDIEAAINSADTLSKAAIETAMAAGKSFQATLTGEKLTDNGTIAITLA